MVVVVGMLLGVQGLVVIGLDGTWHGWAWPYSYTLTSPTDKTISSMSPIGASPPRRSGPMRTLTTGRSGRDRRGGTGRRMVLLNSTWGVLHRPRHITPPWLQEQPTAETCAKTRNRHPPKSPDPPKMTAEAGPLFMTTCTSLEFSRCLSRSARNRKKETTHRYKCPPA